MKKKLSLLLAIAIAVSMLPSIASANVAHIDFGKTQTYENVAHYSAFDIVETGNEKYGKAIKLEYDGTDGVHNPAVQPWYFNERIVGGKVLFSFDAYFNPDAIIRFFEFASSNEGLMVFEQGQLRTVHTAKDMNPFNTSPLGANFDADAVTYPTNEWFKFELVIDLDEGMEYYYINGVKVGETIFQRSEKYFTQEDYDKILERDNGEALLDQLQNTLFGSLGSVSMYLYEPISGCFIDNVLVTTIEEIPGEVSAVVTANNEIAVSLSDHIEGLTENAFNLEFVPDGTTYETDINLTLKTENGTSAILVADKAFEAGSYKLKMADGIEGRWGKSFDGAEFEFVIAPSAGGAEGDEGDADEEIGASSVTNFWNFDDGVISSITDVYTVRDDDVEPNRGKILQYAANNRALQLNLDTPWVFNAQAGRKFLYSLDMFIEDEDNNQVEGDYIHLRVMDNEGKINPIALYAGRDHMLDNGNGWGGDGVGGYEVPMGEWFRVDMLLSEADSTVTIYVDGEATGLNFALPKDVNNGAFDGISALYIWDNLDGFTGKVEERVKLDNVRFKEVTDSYGVTIELDDSNFVLTFDETTYITNENLRLYIAADSMAEYEESEFEIIYKDGTTAIIQPSIAMQDKSLAKIEISATSVSGNSASKDEYLVRGPGALGKIKFIDAYGVESETPTAETTKITISFPAGLQNPDVQSADGIIIDLMDEEENYVEYEDSYDEENKIFTLTLGDGEKTSVLGSEKAYTLVIDEGLNSAGETYSRAIYEFETTEGEFILTNAMISRTEGKVKVDYINPTSETGVYYLVFAGYEGNTLEIMEIEEFEVDANSASIDEIVIEISDGDLENCDKISAYIWDGQDFMPFKKSVIR